MIDCIALKNCITQYTYWNDLSDSPLGVCWIRFAVGEDGGKVALLLNIMTVSFYRRKGVASELLKEVSKEADVILTPQGSEEGGKELIKNFGFIYNADFNMWIFLRKEV
jgi:GNAT superfamily N-acetyltransferase